MGANRSVNAFFGDASIPRKTGNRQFGATLSSLFGRRQYNYTEYTSVQSYTSWIHIRGREFVASARYRFLGRDEKLSRDGVFFPVFRQLIKGI